QLDPAHEVGVGVRDAIRGRALDVADAIVVGRIVVVGHGRLAGSHRRETSLGANGLSHRHSGLRCARRFTARSRAIRQERPPGTCRGAAGGSGNLRHAMQSFRLTYCGNVHASYELGAWLRAVGECVAPVAAAAVAARRAFGLGSWWPAPLAAALATDAAVR